MKIAVTDAEAQASAEAQADLAHLEDLVGSLPSPQELKDIKISPLDFEKVSSTQTDSTVIAPVFGTLNGAISNFQTWFVRTVMEALKYCWM